MQRYTRSLRFSPFMVVHFVTAVAIAIALGGAASAQVTTCTALTLYGNASASRLCRAISPTTQHLWVCELSDNPDIHVTFNRATNLHITVNKPAVPGVAPACNGNANLTGALGGLALAGGAPAAICGIGLQNYLDRLNAVPAPPAPPAVPAIAPVCKSGFLAAQAGNRITAPVSAGYQTECAVAPACP